MSICKRHKPQGEIPGALFPFHFPMEIQMELLAFSKDKIKTGLAFRIQTLNAAINLRDWETWQNTDKHNDLSALKIIVADCFARFIMPDEQHLLFEEVVVFDPVHYTGVIMLYSEILEIKGKTQVSGSFIAPQVRDESKPYAVQRSHGQTDYQATCLGLIVRITGY